MYALRSFAGAAVIAAAVTAMPAFAQEVFEKDRFQLFQGELTLNGEPSSLPMLIDTQFGRTWMLARDGDSYVWRRVNIVRQDKVPQGLLGRPAPAQPPATPQSR